MHQWFGWESAAAISRLGRAVRQFELRISGEIGDLSWRDFARVGRSRELEVTPQSGEEEETDDFLSVVECRIDVYFAVHRAGQGHQPANRSTSEPSTKPARQSRMARFTISMA